MKAAIYNRYGGPEVLEVVETEKPQIAEDEILLKNLATSVNSADIRLRKADPFLIRLVYGLFKPKNKTLGIVFSGVIEKVGSNVKNFFPGDEVFGLCVSEMGAYGEYLKLKNTATISKKPKNLSFAETASLPFGGHTALHFLQKVKIQPGQKVLVYGASGAVGVMLVQLAKYYGAQVTAVCSTKNIDLVKSLGADQVIDYTQEDLEKYAGHFDVVFETVNKISVKKAASLAKTGGTLVLIAGLIKEMLASIFVGRKVKVIIGPAQEKVEDMELLKKLAEEKLVLPVIDKTYPLDKIVQAHQYVDSGHKVGAVIVNIA